MKTAFAYWDTRIAPVFDTALHIHMVETESGKIIAETQETLSDSLPLHKVARLAELGINTLVCGAVSRSLQVMIVARGITVFPFIAGDLHEVIRAWLDGNLANDSFAMPGCCGRGLGRGLGRGRGGAQADIRCGGRGRRRTGSI